MTGDIAVVIVTNAFTPRIGGISGYVSQLADGLPGQGVQVRVLAMPEAFNQLDEIAHGRIAWWRTIHVLFVSLFVVYAIGRILSLRLRNGEVIVHSHSASYCMFLGALAQVWGCHSIHTFHSPLSRRKRTLQLLAHRLDAVVFVSQALRDLYALLGVGPSETWIIPGGVNLEMYRPPSVAEKLEARAVVSSRFPDGRIPGCLVLYVGRIVQEKGVDVLLSACALLVPSDTDLRTLVLGPFDLSPDGVHFRTRCEQMVTDLGLKERAVLTGSVPPSWLKSAYWAADLFVCPSVWPEPAPLVVAEALASGIPVIASQTGGLSERVDERVNGRLLPPSDPKALASAIAELSQNAQIRSEYSRNARERAVQDLGTDSFIRRHLEMYEHIAKGPGGETFGNSMSPECRR